MEMQKVNGQSGGASSKKKNRRTKNGVETLPASIYGVGVYCLQRINPLTYFSLNYAQIPLFCADMHKNYVIHGFGDFLKHEFVYYVTALLWARLLAIKSKQRVMRLTEVEEQILEDPPFNSFEFNIPHPLYVYFSSLGRFEDPRGGDHQLQVPPLPTSVVEQLGGYHAEAVTEKSHNLFEEVPCLGIIGDVLMTVASTAKKDTLSDPPVRIGVPEGSRIQWECVAGYVGPVTSSEISSVSTNLRLKAHGITNTTFKEDIPGTRINSEYLRNLSNIIGRNHAFKAVACNLVTMPMSGEDCQAIQSQPCCPSETEMWLNRTVTMQSFSLEPVTSMSKACAYGYQVFKEDGPGDERMEKVANWSCLAADETLPVAERWTMPDSWYAGRNARRELPEELGTLNSQTGLMQQDKHRRRIVQAFYNHDNRENP